MVWVMAWVRVTVTVMVGVRVRMVFRSKVRLGLGLEQTTSAPFLTVYADPRPRRNAWLVYL